MLGKRCINVNQRILIINTPALVHINYVCLRMHSHTLCTCLDIYGHVFICSIFYRSEGLPLTGYLIPGRKGSGVWTTGLDLRRVLSLDDGWMNGWMDGRWKMEDVR